MKQLRRFVARIVLSSIMLFASAIVGTAAIINLPQTGQVTCYNASGTVIPCAGTGQDGDIRAGVPSPIPRFVNNLDGTITDRMTGLMWLQDAGCFYEPWHEALSKVADFNAHPGNYACANYTAAYNDWRLPNIIELESLPNEGVPNDAAWLDAQGFLGVNQTNYFWSSTNLVWWGTNAWGFDAQYRYVQPYVGVGPGSGSFNFLPVRLGQQGSPDPTYPANAWRTGQTVCFDASRNTISCTGTGQDGETLRGVAWPDPRFTDNGNGTVTDNLTGLIWLKDMTCLGAPNWQGALNAVADFNSNPGNYACKDYVAALNDWRLPNRKELLSIVDFSQSMVALPPVYSDIFANVGSYSLWSSTSCSPATHGANYAWQLWLSDGEIQPHIKSDSGYIAWAVRGGPTGSANFADLSLSEADSPDPVGLNQPLTYTITVTNNGPDQANGVSLADNLPAGVTFVSANSGQGSCLHSNGVVTCTIGSISNSAHVTVTINVLATSQSGTLTNRTSLSSTSIDLDPANNTAVVYTTVAGPINLPRTSQTTSYASRDDGAIRAGIVPPDQRFTIVYCNASGPCANQGSDCDSNASTDIVTDNLTGLIWARDGNISGAAHGGAWLFAINDVQNVVNVGNGLCGYKDWRVPNVNELVEFGISSSLNTQGFVNVQSYNYWSSTTSPGDTAQALVAQGQYSWPFLKSDFMYHGFIPVRGGTNLPAQVGRTGQTISYATGDDGAIKAGIPWPTPRFANANGSTPVTGDVVLDSFTGLMWTKNANLPNTLLTWNGGLDYIANMNAGAGYGGYTDWRLPNFIELRSLWDLSQNPALPSGNPFANLNTIYWSSSTNPDNANEAFCDGFIGINAGIIGVDTKTEYKWIWPVRGGLTTSPSASSLYAHFAGYGLYTWNGTTWSRIGESQPLSMVASGSTLYATFSGVNGIFKWDGTTWTKIGDSAPASFTASGSSLYAYFAGYGLYTWNGTTWSRIGESQPLSMVASGSTLYATFSGVNGIFKWDGTTWTKIGDSAPASFTASGSSLYAHFAGYGLYTWNGTTWSRIGESQPLSMVASGSTLYATFSGVNGIFKWDGTTWTKIGDSAPASFTASGSSLYAHFAGYGLYTWNGTTWSRIGESQPLSMVASGS